MKNHTTFGKRLLAFALALVMVLSYVPGTAIAEETSTPEAVPVKYFKAVLNREVVEQTPEDEPAGEENPSEAAGDENTGEQDPSQGAEGETTETEPVPTVYKYAVTATLGEEAISAENLKISWFTGLLTNLDETTTVEPVAKDTTELADTTEAVMTVSVEYEGMIILLSNETEETAQVTATWDLQAPTGWNTPMYVGIPVAVNPAAFNYNKHSFGSAPAAYFVNNDYVSYDEETGLVASKTSDYRHRRRSVC